MTPIVKTLATVALVWAGIEILQRLWLRAERRHFGYRDRIRAEKLAAAITTGFAIGVLVTSVWSQ